MAARNSNSNTGNSRSKQPAKSSQSKKMSAADVKKQLQEDAQKIKDRVSAPETNQISIKDRMFTFPDGQVYTDSVELVVVDFVAWNSYYPDQFDPKNPKPPVCFAYGESLSTLAPSENAPEPQSDACSGCWANEFESGVGNGKACKNQRRLAVVPVHADDPENAPMFTLMVPPSSIKKFDGFVNTVARLYEVPPVGVSVTVRMNPEVNYSNLIFENPEPNQNIAAHYNRLQEARELITVEPDLSGYEPPKKSSGKGSRARR